MIRIAALLVVWLLATIPAVADTAPPRALHGKSVIIGWDETRMQRNAGQPNFYQIKTGQSISAYVSVNGRVFNRFQIQTPAGNWSNDQSPDERAMPPRTPDFNERTLSMTLPFQTGGSRKIEVEFDAAFGKCTTKVTYAKPAAGGNELVFSPVTKRIVEFQSLTPSAERCAVRAGNVFADD
jgi:hypothetical protein